MSNPQFIAAENGSKFLFDQDFSIAGISIGEPTEFDLNFYHWGNVTYPCGQQFGAVRTQLARIEAVIDVGPVANEVSQPTINLNSTVQPFYQACPTYGLPESVSYPLNSVPSLFTIKDVTFQLIYNATGYSTPILNGSRFYNPGFSMVFNVTEGLRQERFMFFWPTNTPIGLPSSPVPGDSYPAEMSWFLNGTEPCLNATIPAPVYGAWNDTISMSDFSLCASECGAQSPLLIGVLSVHSTSPLYSLQLLVNGTLQEERNLSQDPLTIYSLQYQGSISPTAIAEGNVYQIELVAMFRDGSTSTTEALLTAK
jgi:hypothetical protein